MSLIQIELTEDEQKALLGLLMSGTNRIIAEGDPNGWLEHLESVEEKIQGAQDDVHIEHAKLSVVEA
jgi:hypothetical protein